MKSVIGVMVHYYGHDQRLVMAAATMTKRAAGQ
jgi:hypothetical protein